MNGSIFSLRRLRWKLTFSYMLVTVVALLALFLILASAVVAFLRSDLLPALVSQQLRDNVVPRLEEPLSRNPSDADAVQRSLSSALGLSDVSGSSGERLRAGRTGDAYELRELDGGALLVLGRDRHLLASVLPSAEDSGRLPRGERFDAGVVPGLAPLVDAAYGGEQNSGRLSDNTPEGRLLTAIPIQNRDGRVVGVLVGTLRLPNLTATLLITVGASLLLLAVPAAFLGTIFGFLTAWGLTRRLRRLALAAKSWSRGDFSVLVKDRSRDELGELARELNRMARDVEGLVQTRGELATLEARNRFARDLHDSVKQQIFATSMQIAAARALVRRDPEAAEARLVQAAELVRQSQKELNVLIHEMRPAALEGKGLPSALRDCAAEWSRRAEIPIEVHVRGERETPLEVEQALFRVAQEAMANVAKHSHAKHAEVDLIFSKDTLTLRVADDGEGFDPSRNGNQGFGMHSMRERVLKLGGRMEVDSKPGGGTRITCVLPLGAPDAPEGAKEREAWQIR